ncbi:hypothetical protein [Nonomuraea dietziae]|uniref:hypothetical protein n=1 Tax=Nonomuraea dietziae TaxID=65515 RepID=UPI0031DC597F
MSASSAASRGRTSTTVSVRSPALILTVPAQISMTAEIGSGVSKAGMASPPGGLGGVRAAGAKVERWVRPAPDGRGAPMAAHQRTQPV